MSYSKISIEDRKQRQDLYNVSHAEFPQVGDYWHERFSPYFVVLDVLDDHVVICDKKMDVDINHWCFDYREYKVITKQEMVKQIKYSTMDKFVADVCPEHMLEDIEEWKHQLYKCGVKE